jgi:hypothetical protein
VLTFLKTFVQLHTLGAIYHLREEWQVGHLFLYSTLVFYFFFFALPFTCNEASDDGTAWSLQCL